MLGGRRPWPAAEGQRTLLVLSDGRDTSDTAARRRHRRRSPTARSTSTSSPLEQIRRRGRSAPGAGRRRQGRGHHRRRRRPDRGVRRRGGRARPPDRWSPPRCPTRSTATEATVAVTLGRRRPATLTAEAFAPVRGRRGRHAPRRRRGRPPTAAWSICRTTWMYGGVGAIGLGLLVAAPGRPGAAAGQARLTPERAGRGLRRPARRHGTPVRSAAEADQAADPGHGRRREGAAPATSSLEDADRRAGSRARAARSSRPSGCCCTSAIFVGAGLLGLLLGGGNIVLGLVFLVVGAVGPWIYLRLQAAAAGARRSTRAPRHPAADVRVARRRPLAGPVGRHHRPRGQRADRRRVPAGARRDPARRHPRGRARGRRRAHARARTSPGS